MSIFIEKETDFVLNFEPENVIKKVINYTCDYMNCPYETEVNVVLTDNEGIHKVNKEYRNIDSPTDVLSFPMIEYDIAGNLGFSEKIGDDMFNPDTGELILGDIMISLEKVSEQAKQYGHSEYREMGFLVAHSMLHLFGYDHIEEEERIIMEAKQSEIMDALKIYR